MLREHSEPVAIASQIGKRFDRNTLFRQIGTENIDDHIRRQIAGGKKAFAYFNNDLNVRAPNNAELLLKMCGK